MIFLNQYRKPIVLISILCLSLALLLFGSRLFQGIGLFLFGLAISYPVYSALRFAPDGWEIRSTLDSVSLPPSKAPSICISEDLIKGPLETEGDLILPGGTFPVSRIRSLPGGVLLCAAIAATYDHTSAAEEIRSLFPQMNLDPEQFHHRFSLLRILHLSSVAGQVVQDGRGERVFFCVDSEDSNRIRLMQHCRFMQTEGTPKEMEEAEKRQFLDPPSHAVLLFTGVPRGSQVDGLTFLGALSLKRIQRFDTSVLSDIRFLESKGLPVSLAHPLQAAVDTVLPPSPVPVRAADQHAFYLERRSDNASSLRDAVEQVLLFRSSVTRLFWFHTAFILAITLLMFFSPLPAVLALPFLGLSLIFPWLFHQHKLHTVPDSPSGLSIFFTFLIVLLDNLLVFLLVFYTNSSAWQQSVVFHMFMFSFLYCSYLPYACLHHRFPSLRFLLLFCGAFLALAFAAWMICGLQGVFSIGLASLAGLLLLAVGLRDGSRHWGV